LDGRFKEVWRMIYNLKDVVRIGPDLCVGYNDELGWIKFESEYDINDFVEIDQILGSYEPKIMEVIPMGEVINMFDKKTKVKKESEEIETFFEEIMRKNAENKERIKKERSKHNKGVTKSHRLKKD
jgi:hypothetical protein